MILVGPFQRKILYDSVILWTLKLYPNTNGKQQCAAFVQKFFRPHYALQKRPVLMLFNIYIEVEVLAKTRQSICPKAIPAFNVWQLLPQEAWTVSTWEAGWGAQGQKKFCCGGDSAELPTSNYFVVQGLYFRWELVWFPEPDVLSLVWFRLAHRTNSHMDRYAPWWAGTFRVCLKFS